MPASPQCLRSYDCYDYVGARREKSTSAASRVEQYDREPVFTVRLLVAEGSSEYSGFKLIAYLPEEHIEPQVYT